MISVPNPETADNLTDAAREAVYYLRPDHIRFLLEVWPHRIDGKQAVCRHCCDLSGERDYEAIRQYAAQHGLGALHGLCGEVAARGQRRTGSAVVHLLVLLAVAGLLVALAIAGLQ